MAAGTNETAGGSGAALIEFLNQAMQRGLVPPQTGANYLVACRDILPLVLGEDWTRADVTSLDMGNVRHRLTATKGDRQLSRFNEQFLPAIEEFRKHLGLAPSPEGVEIPTDPVPSAQPDPGKNGDVRKHRTDPPRRRRVPTPTPPPTTTATDPLPIPAPPRRTNGDAKGTSPRKRRRVDSSPSEKSPPLLDKPEVSIVDSSPVPPSFGVIPHLFPLRDGILATLLLPADLTVLEARRLTAFIESLALSDDPDLPGAAGYADRNGSGVRTKSREKELLP